MYQGLIHPRRFMSLFFLASLPYLLKNSSSSIGLNSISDVIKRQKVFSLFFPPNVLHFSFYGKCSETNYFWPPKRSRDWTGITWIYSWELIIFTILGHKITCVWKSEFRGILCFYLLYGAALNHGHIIGSLTKANRPWWWSLGTPWLSVWNSASLISLFSVVS